jgi:tRNA pseudouridine38/39 synthase
MRSAAQKFVGEHDFRNFCKMDVNGGITNFRRRILSFQIDCLGDDSPYQMCVMTITGQAFLWHQVRCMAAILLLIGQGLEQPEVLEHMLDISRCPGKPQYTMASEYPLLLYDCAFEEVKWINQTADSHQHVVEHFQSLWSSHMIKWCRIEFESCVSHH